MEIKKNILFMPHLLAKKNNYYLEANFSLNKIIMWEKHLFLFLLIIGIIYNC